MAAVVIDASHRFGAVQPGITNLALVAPVEESRQGVTELVEAFLKARKMQSTAASYHKDIVGFLAFLSEHGVGFYSASREDVDDWRLFMEAEGLAPSTRARRLAAVTGLYTYGICESRRFPGVTHNPAKDVARPEVVDNVQYLGLSERQIAGLLDAVESRDYRRKDRNWLRTAAIINVLTYTGVRKSELQTADVASLLQEREHDLLHVVRKGGRTQSLVLPPEPNRVLERYLDGRTTGPLLISEDGRRLDGSGIYRAVQRLGKFALPGLAANLHPHDMRHSFATLMYKLGAHDWEVQALLGHADVRTTRRYNHARLILDESPQYRLADLLVKARGHEL